VVKIVTFPQKKSHFKRIK